MNKQEISIETLFDLIEMKKSLPQENGIDEEFENFSELKKKFLNLKKEKLILVKKIDDIRNEIATIKDKKQKT